MAVHACPPLCCLCSWSQQPSQSRCHKICSRQESLACLAATALSPGTYIHQLCMMLQGRCRSLASGRSPTKSRAPPPLPSSLPQALELTKHPQRGLRAPSWPMLLRLRLARNQGLVTAQVLAHSCILLASQCCGDCQMDSSCTKMIVERGVRPVTGAVQAEDSCSSVPGCGGMLLMELSQAAMLAQMPRLHGSCLGDSNRQPHP